MTHEREPRRRVIRWLAVVLAVTALLITEPLFFQRQYWCPRCKPSSEWWPTHTRDAYQPEDFMPGGRKHGCRVCGGINEPVTLARRLLAGLTERRHASRGGAQPLRGLQDPVRPRR